MKKRNVSIDFFSWHIYATEPAQIVDKAKRIKKLLNDNGYDKTESILNEWNYVKGGEYEFVYSIKTIIDMKGAAFNMACMSSAQHAPIDMLMYYDTRPSAFCGIFDYYTYEPLKGYYPFKWYGMFYDAEKEIKSENQIDDIYALCGVDKCGKASAIITYYSDNDSAESKNITVDFGKKGIYEIYLLDREHNGEQIKTTDNLNFDMRVHSVILIKETNY